MTNAELVKKLKKKGIKFLAHGSRHDIYYNPKTGAQASILRHWSQQVDAGTLSSIRKNLGVNV